MTDDLRATSEFRSNIASDFREHRSKSPIRSSQRDDRVRDKRERAIAKTKSQSEPGTGIDDRLRHMHGTDNDTENEVEMPYEIVSQRRGTTTPATVANTKGMDIFILSEDMTAAIGTPGSSGDGYRKRRSISITELKSAEELDSEDNAISKAVYFCLKFEFREWRKRRADKRKDRFDRFQRNLSMDNISAMDKKEGVSPVLTSAYPTRAMSPHALGNTSANSLFVASPTTGALETPKMDSSLLNPILSTRRGGVDSYLDIADEDYDPDLDRDQDQEHNIGHTRNDSASSVVIRHEKVPSLTILSIFGATEPDKSVTPAQPTIPLMPSMPSASSVMSMPTPVTAHRRGAMTGMLPQDLGLSRPSRLATNQRTSSWMGGSLTRDEPAVDMSSFLSSQREELGFLSASDAQLLRDTNAAQDDMSGYFIQGPNSADNSDYHIDPFGRGQSRKSSVVDPARLTHIRRQSTQMMQGYDQSLVNFLVKLEEYRLEGKPVPLEILLSEKALHPMAVE
ncbi:hypothetical protein RFI_33450 [Reticulomyxa filosa]|uniref:Uncharacterized protein n=1 Tax=Reticulomyxa filosa TaxID=46433 RepID=X6LQR6_RETFI|nr:hypothetical protein RFI_33450 [Reticulomyxa filosa]|eukprot:ETO03954.1 hypothetical protein RFI_33450 [Reticulomyxa filosa]